MSSAIAESAAAASTGPATVLRGLTWKKYQTIARTLGSERAVRLKYLDGDLEIVSPSQPHEDWKGRIGDLLAVYCEARDIEFFNHGSTTFRAPNQIAGGEPDESFCFETDKKIPDLAVEVVVSSGGIDRLGWYRNLGVPEVWIWEGSSLRMYRLRDGDYAEVKRSVLFPDIDPAVFEKCVQTPGGLKASRAFRKSLSKRGRR